jgi:hypothetical protein
VTVDRQKGDIIFLCDGCPDDLETNTANWDSARNFLRRENWATAKDGDEWKHFCPDCKGDTRLRRA